MSRNEFYWQNDTGLLGVKFLRKNAMAIHRETLSIAQSLVITVNTTLHYKYIDYTIHL